MFGPPEVQVLLDKNLTSPSSRRQLHWTWLCMECSGFHTGTCEPSVGFPPKQSTMGSEVRQHPAMPSGKCPGSLEAAQEKLKHFLPELEHCEQWKAHGLLTFYILLWTTPIAIFLIFNFFYP